jgi:hypothetical protein
MRLHVTIIQKANMTWNLNVLFHEVDLNKTIPNKLLFLKKEHCSKMKVVYYFAQHVNWFKVAVVWTDEKEI